MKILLVHPHDINSPVEPWTIRIVSIAGELVSMGHDVTLAHFPRRCDATKRPACVAGIRVIAFDRRPGPHIFLRNIIRMCRLAGSADVVHFQKCFHWAALAAACAAYCRRKPLHYDWDDWEEHIWYESCGRNFHSRCVGFFLQTLERRLPVLSDSVSCASRRLKEMVLSFGADDAMVFDTPVGADLVLFHPSVSGREVRQKYSVSGNLVLYVGQLHGAQYTRLFIEAAEIVLGRKPDTSFMIVGEGFLEHALKTMVSERGLTDRVILTGSVPHDRVPVYVAAATVCVACFDDTTVTRCKSPLKLAEYMAAGKAVVASDVGDVRTMLEGAGILTQPGDPRGLAEGILSLLEQPGRRPELEKASRMRAEEKYNWRSTAESLVSAYKKIAGKHS